jgi:hypothetical protein
MRSNGLILIQILAQSSDLAIFRGAHKYYFAGFYLALLFLTTSTIAYNESLSFLRI